MGSNNTNTDNFQTKNISTTTTLPNITTLANKNHLYTYNGTSAVINIKAHDPSANKVADAQNDTTKTIHTTAKQIT